MFATVRLTDQVIDGAGVLVIDFSPFEIGSQLVLRNGLGSGRTAEVMRFDVVRKETDPSTLPALLRPLERLEPAAASATRDFTLGVDGMTWVINGPDAGGLSRRVGARGAPQSS